MSLLRFSSANGADESQYYKGYWDIHCGPSPSLAVTHRIGHVPTIVGQNEFLRNLKGFIS